MKSEELKATVTPKVLVPSLLIFHCCNLIITEPRLPIMLHSKFIRGWQYLKRSTSLSFHCCPWMPCLLLLFTLYSFFFFCSGNFHKSNTLYLDVGMHIMDQSGLRCLARDTVHRCELATESQSRQVWKPFSPVRLIKVPECVKRHGTTADKFVYKSGYEILVWR